MCDILKLLVVDFQYLVTRLQASFVGQTPNTDSLDVEAAITVKTESETERSVDWNNHADDERHKTMLSAKNQTRLVL